MSRPSRTPPRTSARRRCGRDEPSPDPRDRGDGGGVERDLGKPDLAGDVLPVETDARLPLREVEVDVGPTPQWPRPRPGPGSGEGSPAPARRARRRDTSHRCRCRARRAAPRARGRRVDLPAPDGPSIATTADRSGLAVARAERARGFGPARRSARPRAASARRYAPGGSAGSRIGPIAIRFSFETGCPMVSNIRRICRVRPSLRIDAQPGVALASRSRAVVEIRSISEGRVRAPSSEIPRRTFARLRLGGLARDLHPVLLGSSRSTGA